jgi:glycosyltransferase involved in cell wall biosynthesis
VVMTLHDFKLLCPNYTFMRQERPCEECRGKHFYRAVKYKCVKNSYLKSAVSALEMYVHRINRTYLGLVDRFIALSGFTQQKLIQYGWPQDRVIYLPNCVDLPAYRIEAAHQRYALFLGALSDKNGILDLLRAMRRIPKIKLKVAGQGEQDQLARDYVRDNGMDNVELLGFITDRELERILAGCEFLVFPSNCYHNCPMSVLESFAHGKPVIASNLGSLPELVRDKITGLLSEPGDEEALAEAIRSLWNQPELTGRLGRNARKMVEKDFSPERYYSRLLGIYQGLIRNRKVADSTCPAACS